MNQRPVVNAYVDGDKLIVRTRAVDGSIKVQRLPAEYVTYFRTTEVPDKIRREFRHSRNVRSVAREGEWLRVSWRDRQIRHNLVYDDGSPLKKLRIPVYEGDVSPVRRYLSDTNATIARPRRLFLDLETDSRVPFSKKESARILMWAVNDGAGFVADGVLEEDTDEAETELLKAFWRVAWKYDQLVAWNLDGFDAPVLKARTAMHDLPVNVKNWLLFDHLEAFRKLNAHAAESGDEKTSFKLDDIATALLGEGKHDFDASKTWEAWEAGGKRREELRQYMIQDVALLPRIEAKTGYIGLTQTLAEVCAVIPNTDSLDTVKQMDGYLIRLGRERGMRFPSKAKTKYGAPREQFAGAYVMKPPKFKGIARNVHVCDFRRLYPSVILSWGMSPETKRDIPINGPIPEGHCRAPKTGIGFATTVIGILSVALREMIRLREEWAQKKASLTPGTPEWVDADRMSNAYKVAANSFYGGIGSEFSRFFDREVAESVTQTGVWLLLETKAAAEREDWFVGYGDTDSLFVSGVTTEEFKAFTEKCNAELYPALLKKQGCVVNDVHLSYEKAFDRIVFTSAKRYAGWYLHYKGKPPNEKSKPEIKGLEYKRGDAVRLARELQWQVIEEIIVKGNDDKEVIRNLVMKMRAHVLEGELPERDVLQSKSLSKSLKEYKVKIKTDGSPSSQPPHVVIAHQLKKRGQDVGEGTRIEYVVVDGAASPMRVAPAEDYATGKVQADRFYLWENLIYPATQRFLEAAFPEDDQWEKIAKARPRKPRKGGAAPGQEKLQIVTTTPGSGRGKGKKKTETTTRDLFESDPIAFLQGPKKKPDPEENFGYSVAAESAQGKLEELRKVIATYPGDTPFFLNILTGEAAVMVDIKMKVRPCDELRSALDTWAS